MDGFLASDDVIDWEHSTVRAKAQHLARGLVCRNEIARNLFDWVRDNVKHSGDHRISPVTCSASEVLTAGAGICFAKSHLLAALLRARRIPAGFCYQRLSIDGTGPPFSLHGFNAVHLPQHGWYRVDPRGDKPGVSTQFDPPRERLAFRPQLDGERTFDEIHAQPLPIVVSVLRRCRTLQQLWANLPDVSSL